MGFKLVPLVAFGILGVGNLLHIIGLATPEWVTADVTVLFQSYETTRGLWEGCVDGNCDSYDDDQKSDWLKACEALAILGMLVGCLAALLAGLIFIMNLMSKDTPKSLGLLSILAAIVAFILISICVIIYAVKAKEAESGWYFGYSFGLSIAGAILIAMGGCFAFAGSC